MLRAYFDLPRRVHLLCLGAFVQRAGGLILPFLAIDLAHRRGLGETFATLTLSAFGAGTFVASMIGGVLADRFGRRPLMLIALFGAAVWSLVLYNLESRGAILLGVFCFALTGSLYFPASSAMVADVTPDDDRPRAYALMYAALNFGFAFAAAIGGQIAERSFFWLFGGEAIATTLFGLLVLAFVGESRPSASTDETRDIGARRVMLSDRGFVAMLTATLLLGILFQQPFATLSLAIVNSGLTPDVYGNVMAFNGVLIAVLQLPIAGILTNYRTTPFLILSAVLLGAGFGLTSLASTPVGYALTVFVWTIGEIILWSLNQAAVAKMAPVELRATYFGAFTGAFGGAMMIGPVVGGFVLQHAGPTALWSGCAVVGFIAAIIFSTLKQRLDGPAPTAEPEAELSC